MCLWSSGILRGVLSYFWSVFGLCFNKAFWANINHCNSTYLCNCAWWFLEILQHCCFVITYNPCTDNKALLSLCGRDLVMDLDYDGIQWTACINFKLLHHLQQLISTCYTIIYKTLAVENLSGFGGWQPIHHAKFYPTIIFILAYFTVQDNQSANVLSAKMFLAVIYQSIVPPNFVLYCWCLFQSF